jgi:tRNA (guanine10-N2)-dimethyltransferase
MLEDQLAVRTPTGKLRFGFSIYPGDKTITGSMIQNYSKKLRPLGITWKKALRELGKSVRLVESREPVLSSVIVKKEHLLETKSDFILAVYNKEIIVAQTCAVQDYQTFSKQDYGRPQRDPQSGMLPPKVARMLFNIARPTMDDTILDPFCGSGTVLQEALLLGYTKVIGSDVSKKSIADSQANLNWLKLPTIPLYAHDILTINQIIPAQSINCIVSEGDLGPVQPNKTEQIHRQLSQFYQTVLRTLPTILASGARVVLALPSWRRSYDTLTLDLEPTLSQHFSSFHSPIFYSRPDATVVRQIYFLKYDV